MMIYRYSAGEKGKISPAIKKEKLSCIDAGDGYIVSKSCIRNSKMQNISITVPKRCVGIPEDYDKLVLWLESENDKIAMDYFRGLILNKIQKQVDIIAKSTEKKEELELSLKNLKIDVNKESITDFVERYAKENHVSVLYIGEHGFLAKDASGNEKFVEF